MLKKSYEQLFLTMHPFMHVWVITNHTFFFLSPHTFTVCQRNLSCQHLCLHGKESALSYNQVLWLLIMYRNLLKLTVT